MYNAKISAEENLRHNTLLQNKQLIGEQYFNPRPCQELNSRHPAYSLVILLAELWQFQWKQ
jgi:hypothetical protein